MFLLPALAAGTADVLILYLSRHESRTEHAEQEVVENAFISNVFYLVPLAMIRLFLLLIPLPYHTYTGTAVKYPNLYRALHYVTLILVLIHMLSIIMLDPDSLNSFLPIDILLTRNLKKATTMRHVWVLLTLTLWSTVFHMILVWHVRSTAQPKFLDPGRKKVLYYYANQNKQAKSNEDETRIENERNEHVVVVEEPNNTRQQLRTFPGEDLLLQMKCISDGGNDFMAELQTRVDTARKEWAQRLEDVTKRISSSHGDQGRTGTISNGGSMTQRTPFRVLLQLFAYEDVLNNHRLDHVFDMDDGVSLTFYVPQLLSFLLHGAFQSSPQLEEWILDKCSKNVHFAHRCYWFLRAWCLEGSSLRRSPSRRSLSSNSNASMGSLTWGDEQQQQSPSLKLQRRFPSFGSLASESSLDLETVKRPTRLDPEEHSLIEALMFRVMERAEIPAYTLHFGSGHAEEDMTVELVALGNGQRTEEEGIVSQIPEYEEASSTAIANATATGFIPVDPNYGFPSVRHLDSVSATRKFGFMPLDARTENWMISENLFDNTPRFLDALTAITDNLFLMPRERRTYELRKQLRSMEVELLPCNSIYVPIGNAKHRVWRIVAEESIAISTKERVPCIICLEVVDYAVKQPSAKRRSFLENALRLPKQETDKEAKSPAVNTPLPVGNSGKIKFSLPGQPSNLTERERIRLWQMSLRHPQRHNTLLDKVTNITQMGLRKLVDHNNPDAMLWGNGEGSGSWKDFVRMPSSPSRINSQAEDEIDSEVASLTANDVERRVSSATKPPLPPTSGVIPRSSPPIMTSSPAATKTKLPVSGDVPSTCSSRQSSRPSSPTTAMGQWSTPTPNESPEAKQEQMTDDVRSALMAVSDSLGGQRRSSNGSLNGSSHSASAYGSTREPTGLVESPAEEVQKLPISRVGHDSDAGLNGSDATASKKKRRRPPPVVFKESWSSKQERIRAKSAYGSHPGWRLLPILIKPNDDLRQEQLASQLIYRMASILAREKVAVWLCPYEIVALTDRGGIIEAISDTISLDSLKRNDPNFTTLPNFFHRHFGEGTDELADAKANFVESLAAYSIVCYLLQIKDRHNGNILLDNRGHLIHIDFGFFFLSSPGKNSGFESAPFKLTREFVDLMDGPDSKTFRTFRELCCRTFISLRRHCYEITLLVEMLMVGNEDLACFRGRPEDAVRGLRERFRLSLNDRACMEYVNELVDESLVSWRTRWYDRYQRFCVGVL